MARILLTSLLLAALSACGSEPQGKSTAKLDAVEVQPGTISDSMIILDDASGDGTAIDNSVADDSAKAKASKAEADEPADDGAEGDEETAEATDISAPIGKKAAEPANKGE